MTFAIRTTVVALFAALALTGCGGTTAKKTAEQPSKSFDDVASLRQAYISAGGTCGSFSIRQDPEFKDSTVGDCGDRIDTPNPGFAVATTGDAKKQYENLWLALTTTPDKPVLLVGENWIVRTFSTEPDDIHAIQARMGGKIIDSTKSVTPTAQVVYTFVSKAPFVRFAAVISNPSKRTRTGVITTWKALDSDGVIVGTHDLVQPPIPPGQTIVYVGGAGSANLSGTPARVTVEITDEGKMVGAKPVQAASVASVSFKRSGFDMNAGAHDYEVSVTIVAHTDVTTSDLNIPVLIRDKENKIIGADWADLGTAPARLADGDKVKVIATVSVDSGIPKSAEAYVSE